MSKHVTDLVRSKVGSGHAVPTRRTWPVKHSLNKRKDRKADERLLQGLDQGNTHMKEKKERRTRNLQRKVKTKIKYERVVINVCVFSR